MSYLAPAGTPISLTTYAAALLHGLARADVATDLARNLAAHSGRERCWLLSTGRAAMTLALAAMRDAAADPRRTEVIVPAYTCYSVPASVLKAGLQPRLCDVNPLTLSLDVERLASRDFSRVLAIVTANLYGVPNDLTAIERIARRAGVYLLDDAAQALGAACDDRPAGGFGDIGLYSFDKGKNITSLEGGAIVASDPALAAAIETRHAQLEAPSAAGTTTALVKLAAYAVLLRPQLYGTVRRLPMLGLGRTLYDDSYPLRKYSAVLAAFSNRLYARLPQITEKRRSNAQALKESLAGSPCVQVITAPMGARPAYTRLPILIDDPRRRASVINALDRMGVGATTSYPHALCDVPEVAAHIPAEDQAMPGARSVAQRIVTLPVHAYCSSPTYPAAVRATLDRLAAA